MIYVLDNGQPYSANQLHFVDVGENPPADIEQQLLAKLRLDEEPSIVCVAPSLDWRGKGDMWTLGEFLAADWRDL